MEWVKVPKPATIADLRASGHVRETVKHELRRNLLKASEHPELIAPDALETNAYTPERWADALDARTALAPVLEIIEGCTWLGHNPAFDIDRYFYVSYNQKF